MDDNSKLSGITMFLAIAAVVMYIIKYFTNTDILTNIGTLLLGVTLIFAANDIRKENGRKGVAVASLVIGMGVAIFEVIMLIVKYV